MGFFDKQKYVGSTYIYFFFLKTASKQLFGQIYVKKIKIKYVGSTYIRNIEICR